MFVSFCFQIKQKPCHPEQWRGILHLGVEIFETTVAALRVKPTGRAAVCTPMCTQIAMNGDCLRMKRYRSLIPRPKRPRQVTKRSVLLSMYNYVIIDNGVRWNATTFFYALFCRNAFLRGEIVEKFLEISFERCFRMYL